MTDSAEDISEKKKFVRSSRHIIFGGICGALGERTHHSPWLFRGLVLFGTVITGILPGVVIYSIVWFMTPLAES